MPAVLRILMLEDSVSDADIISRELSRASLRHELMRVESKDDFLRALVEYEPDVILSDHTMPGYDGLSALRETREKRPGAPFIFVSGTLGEERAVESLKQGASDYVIKSDLMRLPSAIERAIEERHLRHEREQIEQRLHHSESQFRSLAEQAPIGIFLCDAKGKVLFVNAAWGKIAGRRTDELYTADWPSLIHQDDREAVNSLLTNMRQDQRPLAFDCRLLQPSGEIRWLSTRNVGQYNAAGELTGFINLSSDITEQKLAEQKIARMNRIQAVLSGINSTIVRVSDREKLCRDVCHIAINKGNFRLAWIALVDPESHQLSRAQALGQDPALLEALRFWQPRTLEEVNPHAEQAYTTQQPVVVDRIEPSCIEASWAGLMQQADIQSMVYLPLRLGDSVSGLLVLLADSADFFTSDEMHLLNELAEDIAFAFNHLDKQERLNYLAYYDPLTELPNRTLFFDHLRQHIDNARSDGHQFMLLVIDIERFRHINESFGERFGDAVLKMAAERMISYTGNIGRLGRLGGDSFGAIVPIRQDVTTLAQEIEHNINEWAKTPFVVLGTEIIVPARIGIATFPQDAENAETLFQNASAALKQAKTSREHLLFYGTETNAQVTEYLHLDTRLRNAVEREQFVLYYQPKINLKTGRIGSVEALMRWQDPERGLIAPGEFIPLLEETGLIYDVGMWALRRAFDDHAKLRKLFSYAPYIAVNVSALQLQRKTFYDDVMRVISPALGGHHGVDIEITESLIMRNIEDNIRKLKAVRDHDVHIAIDDFGTGYSSLAYIARLPIDVLKIDRSFIVKMVEGGEAQTIISAIITLGHSLGLRVVAEGVETEKQAQLLRLLGCDEAQGYLFCRPLPFEDLVERLTMVDNLVVLKPE